MTSASFAKMLTKTADTKRSVYSNGKWGKAETYLSEVKCTPKHPIAPEISARDTLETPVELFEVFTETADIQEGHILVYGGTDYPISSVADYLFQNETFLRLVIEELKA
jgi:hypothetical protein